MRFKLYNINSEFNMKTILKTTVKKILQFDILSIICVDFKFLYECFIKLKITYEKRLIINVMSFCQLYEKRKIIEF